MSKSRSRQAKPSKKVSDFDAEAAYADSMFRAALGDGVGAVSALQRALELNPAYAPAILSMGSVEYQRRRRAAGRRLFESLLSLPKTTQDLCEIIDEAGSFLISIGAYRDGLALYRAAAARFPTVAALHQGLGCCAGHEGFHDEAVAASERALQLDSGNQKLVNDLGWGLLQAGRVEEAERMLERAVSMNPSDELAQENLRICRAEITRRHRKRRGA
jgi:tetratricopeptide (TPR) repeat protein